MNRAALMALAAAGVLPFLAHAGPAEPQSPLTRVLVVDPTAKPLSPKQLQGVDKEMSLAQIVGRLGPPHHETGSGLRIFVWLVTDGREFWVGTNGDPAERPIYVKFRDLARHAR